MAVTYVQCPTSGNFPAVAFGTTGGTVVSLANNGISLIENTSTEVFVLAPPQFGVVKTIIASGAPTTTATPTVRLSTNAAQGITGVGGVPWTIMKFAASRSTVAATVVQLLGLSSNTWAITNIFPCMSTGAGNGAITLSTT